MLQNMLFYYDSEGCHRPSGVVLLEGCYCERLITAASSGSRNSAASDKQVRAVSTLKLFRLLGNTLLRLTFNINIYTEFTKYRYFTFISYHLTFVDKIQIPTATYNQKFLFKILININEYMEINSN